MWVLRTNTELTAVEIALRDQRLWMVEQLFRTAKSLLDTSPIFHKIDAKICGHVFCSFLALMLRDELFKSRRLAPSRMRALRKGRGETFALQGGIVGGARIVEREPSALDRAP